MPTTVEILAQCTGCSQTKRIVIVCRCTWFQVANKTIVASSNGMHDHLGTVTPKEKCVGGFSEPRAVKVTLWAKGIKIELATTNLVIMYRYHACLCRLWRRMHWSVL